MYQKITADPKQKLYSIQIDKSSWSTAGFDYIRNGSEQVIAWIREQGYAPAFEVLEYGTEIAYQQYQALMQQASTICALYGIQCNIELTSELVGLEGKRVEVVDKWGETRRFWVSRSSGWMPCHIERARSNSFGGPAVMGTPFQLVRVVR